jgi:hypothetical protein
MKPYREYDLTEKLIVVAAAGFAISAACYTFILVCLVMEHLK